MRFRSFWRNKQVYLTAFNYKGILDDITGKEPCGIVCLMQVLEMSGSCRDADLEPDGNFVSARGARVMSGGTHTMHIGLQAAERGL